jgi:toxin ParE1/3/4
VLNKPTAASLWTAHRPLQKSDRAAKAQRGMKPFVLTPLASRDLSEIWEYLAQDSIEIADQTLAALEKAIRRLARQPGMSHLREDLADRRHRFLLGHSYLIVYRTTIKPLQVIRVLHASRDVQALLRIPSDKL